MILSEKEAVAAFVITSSCMSGAGERSELQERLSVKRSKEPVPVEAHDTVRQAIMHALEEGPLSSLDLSGMIGIPEKEVAGHLEHIRMSLHRSAREFIITPAECVKCGFVFEKRGRLTKPGRCPVCRSESIHAPLFEIGKHRP